MTTGNRKCVNMIWANEAGVSVYIYEAEHDRRTIEIHGVVNDYETVLAAATIEKHNRDRLAEAVGNDLQSQLEQLRAELAEEKRLRSELKQIAQTGIAEVSSVGTALKDIALIDFRSRAIQLCKDKAAEWLNNPQTRYGSAESFAAHLTDELEKL